MVINEIKLNGVGPLKDKQENIPSSGKSVNNVSQGKEVAPSVVGQVEAPSDSLISKEEIAALQSQLVTPVDIDKLAEDTLQGLTMGELLKSDEFMKVIKEVIRLKTEKAM
jgi:hypothetical protein